VSPLCSGLCAVAGHAEKIGFAESPEYIRCRQNLSELRQRLRALLLEGAAESLRIALERLQPYLPITCRVGSFQAANLQIGMFCHLCTFDRFPLGYAYRLLNPAQWRKRRPFE